jgi:diguanylate cyclase (GGDEF)-like protein
LVSIAFVALPFAGWHLPRLPTLQAITATATLCCWSLTAYLTFSQAAVVRSRPLLILASACLAVALLTVPYLLAYPGIIAPHGIFGIADSASWLWVFSQFAFVGFIVAYVRSQQEPVKPWRRGSGRLLAALATATAIALTFIATSSALPGLTSDGDFTSAYRSGISLLIALAYAGTLAYCAAVTRGRTVLNLWLMVTLLALAIDVSLSSVGGGRYTLGWYLARFDRVFASGTLLTVFLLDFTFTSRRLAMLATLDVVSGLANRRALDERLEMYLGYRRRRSDVLSVIMLDIDQFKAFNDRYGHAAGDECLRVVADIIRRALVRGTDLAARYGGEEFVVVLPATDRRGAIVVAERIRSDVEHLSLGAENVPAVTVSLGFVTVSPRTATSVEKVLYAADRAMYAAKAAGRNCIVEAQGSHSALDAGTATA